MESIFGIDANAVAPFVGSRGQVASVDAFVVDQGPGRGARQLRLLNGGGLDVDLHPDRCLDIGQVRYRGVPIAWMGPQGIQPPSRYEPRDFLRSFGGGLLATCGLDTFGDSSDDLGEELFVHGRIGAQQATIESALVDDKAVVVEGTIRQSRFGGENIVLHRRLESPLGSSVLRLTDTVINASARRQPHMILYHVNFGWPLLSESSELLIDALRVEGVDSKAVAEIRQWNRFGKPIAGYEGRVYRHDLVASPISRVLLRNPSLDLAVSLTVDATSLPHLFEWKMLGQNEYVLGLEPANCGTMAGRSDARGRDMLPLLEPEEQVTYHLEWDFDPAI